MENEREYFVDGEGDSRGRGNQKVPLLFTRDPSL
jgi:hypothetical protein